MSYLSLAEGIPDFAKAVISLWFRVPQESIDAARIVEPYEGQRPPLTLCIPLLTFGKEQKGKGLGATTANITTGGATIFDVTGFSVQFPEYPLDPCHIAIDCSGGNPRLQFNIQMNTFATATNFFTSATATSVSGVDSPDVYSQLALQANIPGTGVQTHAETVHQEGFDQFVPFADTYTLRDMSEGYMSESPEYFFVSTTHEIEPDQWHHLLLSFDLSLPVNTKGPPLGPGPSVIEFENEFENGAEGVSDHAMLWYAIDDVDYRGRATDEELAMFGEEGGFLHRLGPYSVDSCEDMSVSEAGDPNGLLTRRAWEVSTSGIGLQYNLKLSPHTYSYEPTPIPTEDEIGIPASARYVEHVYHVEMAEFQLFTGVTLDTGDEQNRRAFVDADGKPVDPNKSGKDGPPGSIELLGQRPDILLRRSSKWKNGKNTGSTGTDEDGQEIPEGQFKPTGGIAAYKPDPSLHGPQNPGER